MNKEEIHNQICWVEGCKESQEEGFFYCKKHLEEIKEGKKIKTARPLAIGNGNIPRDP